MSDGVTAIREAVVTELREYQALHDGYPWTYDFCIEALKAVSADVESPKRSAFLAAMEADELITGSDEGPRAFGDGSMHDIWKAL